METLKTSRAPVQRPNFPPARNGDFTLEIESWPGLKAGIPIMPLRPQSGSGTSLPVWELQSVSSTGVLTGGCAVALPPRGDFPSPRQLPHPVLGEWISALRYTGLNWMECGPLAVAAGFSEEAVIESLWEGLSRLMDRNGVSFLIGTAPTASLALEMALARGARVLEPFSTSPTRYFLYVK